MRDRWITGAVDPDFTFRYCTPWREHTAADLPAAYGLKNVTFADFIRWVWRVQEWSYSFNVNDNGDVRSASGSLSLRGGEPVGVTYTEIAQGEEYRLGGAIGAVKAGTFEDPGPTLFATWGLSFLGSHRYLAPVTPGGPAYFYPAFSWEWYREPLTDLRVFSLGARASTSATLVGTATVNGYTVPLYADGSNLAIPGYTVTASLTLNPARYFERRNRLGLSPVFDQFTGAELAGMDPLRAPLDWRQADAADFSQIAPDGPIPGTATRTRFVS